MRTDLYPRIAPWLRLLAVGLSAPGRYWWIGAIIIGAIVVLGGVTWTQAALFAILWGVTVAGSVVALAVLAAIESRWRAEWTAAQSPDPKP